MRCVFAECIAVAEDGPLCSAHRYTAKREPGNCPLYSLDERVVIIESGQVLRVTARDYHDGLETCARDGWWYTLAGSLLLAEHEICREDQRMGCANEVAFAALATGNDR